MTELEQGLLQLCKDAILCAQHGDYTNGVEHLGIDEGRVRGAEFIERLEAQLKWFEACADQPTHEDAMKIRDEQYPRELLRGTAEEAFKHVRSLEMS